MNQILKAKNIPMDCVEKESDITKENIFQQMKSECNRLYSFQNKWPLRDITPKSLAEAGLFYLQNEDRVQCSFCYIIIFNWNPEDKPLREHMKRSPRCPFLMGRDVGNVPLCTENILDTCVSPASEKKYTSHSVSASYKPKHPRMACIKRRLLTFTGWSLKEPEPQQLAECGLYYSGAADVVTCFFCGGTLGNWEPGDDPWNEHAKYFPECSFLALAKIKRTHSSKIVESSLLNGVSPTGSIISEVVEQALDIFPEDLVHEAVKRKNGSHFSLQEICDGILELKQKPELQSVPTVSLEMASKTKDYSTSNSDLSLCKVCMDREKCVGFQPCGHFVACWTCANQLGECPVCRKPIIHKINIYSL